MSYDSKCYDLAEYFLPLASAETKKELAQILQDAVEDFIEGRRWVHGED